MDRRSFFLTGMSMIATASAMPPLASQAASATPAPAVGLPAPAFEVPDSTGRRRTLSEFKGKTVVLEWTSATCPFAAAQYQSGRMQKLQRWAERKGVVWLTVLSSHPSRSEYLPGAQADIFNRKRGGAPNALLIDASGVMGHAYGAATADHMFIVAANGTLLYAGGIDDANSMDPKEVAASHNFVRSALEDVMARRRIATPITEPFGCALAYAGG